MSALVVLVLAVVPCVTQDNTPPGPTFKARLLHTKTNAGPE